MTAGAAEVALAAIEAYNRRDVDGFCALCADDIEFISFLEGRTEPEPRHGLAGVRRWMEEQHELLDHGRVDEPRLLEIDGRHVVALAVARGRFKASGMQIEAPAGFLFRVDRGRLAYFRGYDTYAEALRAAADALEK